MLENEENSTEIISFVADKFPENMIRDKQLKFRLQIAERCVSLALSEIAGSAGLR
jgi:hypothetical protein